jgi:hypothetical protein
MFNRAPAQQPFTVFTTAAMPGIESVTDAGRSIPLFRFEAVAILRAGEQLAFHSDQARRDFLDGMEQTFLANTNQNPATLVKLVAPSLLSNCHGWLFTGGGFGILDPLVPTILEDNGYSVAEEARDGDLAVFRRGGEVKHSGLVRQDASGTILIESKWGPFGVYLHGPRSHPFAWDCTYYRSRRSGHLLRSIPQLEARLVAAASAYSGQGALPPKSS